MVSDPFLKFLKHFATSGLNGSEQHQLRIFQRALIGLFFFPCDKQTKLACKVECMPTETYLVRMTKMVSLKLVPGLLGIWAFRCRKRFVCHR